MAQVSSKRRGLSDQRLSNLSLRWSGQALWTTHSHFPNNFSGKHRFLISNKKGEQVDQAPIKKELFSIGRSFLSPVEGQIQVHSSTEFNSLIMFSGLFAKTINLSFLIELDSS
jgi:hypothetical protein